MKEKTSIGNKFNKKFAKYKIKTSMKGADKKIEQTQF